MFAARTNERRFSMQRKIAFSKCWMEPAECKNQPSFVTFTSGPAPRRTNCRVNSPSVSSKQINGATRISLVVRRKTVASRPG